MAGIVKVSLWGVTGGAARDINIYSIPQRLVSITICTITGMINGFSFTYVDQRGEPMTVGTWGMFIGYVKQIVLTPGEFVNHLSVTANKMGVTSLKLGTNTGDYGPFGTPNGSEFSLPLRQERSEVVAFFGSAGTVSLKALGVYVLRKEEESHIKVGPWGGHGGFSRDLNMSSMPEQLLSITIRSSERSGGRVYGLSYTYLDKNGQCIHMGPWGSKTKGQKHEFSLNGGNYINFIRGTHDEYGITSLKFISTEDVHGTFGCPAGPTFTVPLPEKAAASHQLLRALYP